MISLLTKRNGGGRARPNWTFSDFKDFINKNELLDIGFEDLPLTWSNLWEGEGEIKQRLDRALSSVEWCEKFKDATVIHIETEASDHNIILLETEPSVKKPKRRFHFDPRWLQYREVEGLIQAAWGKNQVGSRGFRINKKITQCRMTLSAWSRSLNLHSKKEIKRIKEEIQATKTRHGNNNKEAIKLLRKLLSDAYKQEKLFWNQKARTKWLQNGDKNTSYFHACVSGRRKKNRISRLEKEQGGWYTTDEEIGEKIAQFYNQLFTSSKPSEFDEILNGNPRTITEQMNLQLTRPVTEKEIKIAVFSMHPNKSPGPDANSDEAGHIKEILECYGKVSGQQVNINKSAVFFSKNTNGREKEEVLQKLGGIQQVSQRKYLGLPLVVGRSKNSVFSVQTIKEPVQRVKRDDGQILVRK
ncbi:uncharacterized protein [Coffea arabica]|uniref:Reverse transcriptase n=1 Tax=Coffea arabica TaxID=13443 RepID=A0ABM4W660_COFAR